MTLPYKQRVSSGGWGKLWSSISEFLVFAETIASPNLLTFLMDVCYKAFDVIS